MSYCVVIKLKSGRLIYLQMPKDELAPNMQVIVDTPSGREFGIVEKVNVEMSDDSITHDVTFIKVAQALDIESQQKLEQKNESTLKIAKDLVQNCGLKMKLVEAKYSPDYSKVVISFVCEERVDFRDLVKILASTLHCRIELKQIGSRDQAKMVGGIGPCGQVCCCVRFLNEFGKVSVKMAKTQNLSLNPTKISGICGRLMCCLAYENGTYADILKHMPRINSRVGTPDGDGYVMYNNILKEICTVKFQNGDDVKLTDYPVEKLTINVYASSSDSSDSDEKEE